MYEDQGANDFLDVLDRSWLTLPGILTREQRRNFVASTTTLRLRDLLSTARKPLQ